VRLFPSLGCNLGSSLALVSPVKVISEFSLQDLRPSDPPLPRVRRSGIFSRTELKENCRPFLAGIADMALLGVLTI